jgi:hypothetical protein
MAKQSSYVLPDDVEAKLRPWIETMRRRENWGNAREMRSLLEHARDAQAMRISADPKADLSRLEIADIEAALYQLSLIRTCGPNRVARWT